MKILLTGIIPVREKIEVLGDDRREDVRHGVPVCMLPQYLQQYGKIYVELL